MSSLPKNPEPRSAIAAWVSTTIGMVVVPAGLLLAERVHAPWWKLGLWFSAAGSALFAWGLVWVVLGRARTTVETARRLAATLALLLAGAAVTRMLAAQPKRTLDLVAIVLRTHLVAAGLVLVCLGADVIHTAKAYREWTLSSRVETFLLVASGLFAAGWTLQGLAPWRFPLLVTAGALCFLADYLYRRLRDGTR